MRVFGVEKTDRDLFRQYSHINVHWLGVIVTVTTFKSNFEPPMTNFLVRDYEGQLTWKLYQSLNADDNADANANLSTNK